MELSKSETEETGGGLEKKKKFDNSGGCRPEAGNFPQQLKQPCLKSEDEVLKHIQKLTDALQQKHSELPKH